MDFVDNHKIIILVFSYLTGVGVTVYLLIKHLKTKKDKSWRSPAVALLGALWLTIGIITLFLLRPDVFNITLKNNIFLITPLKIIIVVYVLLITIYLARLIKYLFQRFEDKNYRFQQALSLIVLWTIAVVVIIKIFLRKPDTLLKLTLFHLSKAPITIIDLITFLVVISLTAIVLIFIRGYFDRRINQGKIDSGTGVAIYKILSYVVWSTAIVLGVEMMGIDITFLIAGSAALLVGIGMGIQQVFHDFISGIILLTERKIEVGDTIKVEDTIGTVQDVSFRVTTVLTPDNTEIIIPNSKLTAERIVNLTHTQKIARYSVPVGVAYGTDARRVIEVLLDIANNYPDILRKPAPEVIFKELGESSLNFELLFYAHVSLKIYKIKSDLLLAIYERFAHEGIQIPFPQRDVHLFIKNQDNNTAKL